MGLPQINIIFEGLANTVKYRSERGIVAIIVKDVNATKTSYVYKKFEDIKENTFSSKTMEYLKLAFKGNPNKVIIEVISTSAEINKEIALSLENINNDEALNLEKENKDKVKSSNQRTIDNVLKDLELKKFNYLSMPLITTEEKEKIKTWIENKRKIGEIYKAILSKTPADNEGIINFTTTGIKVDEKPYSTDEFCARIAGALAGLPLTRSATYLVLEDVTEITQHDDPDTDIDKGELILTNDGAKIKIGRGVNSLVTVNKPKTNDLKKIKIVESMDMVREDIHTTFEDHYVGQVPNNYDNKILFLSGINGGYFSRLQRDEVLDNKYANYTEIDIKAHEEYLNDRGIDIDTLSEQEIKETNTGSNVFATGKVKFVDAMEDLDLKLFM